MKYILSMFPYPSGSLHMGHFRVYTLADVLARYHSCFGQILVPFGWDAFGLPAENAARDRHIAPSDWTMSNISVMKAQILQMNLRLNWDREINTCAPQYYKFTQFLFLRLYAAGLVEQKHSMVYYDPIDKTVLANEQIKNGRAERSNALVVRKSLLQWYFKISTYSSRLHADLNELDWPDAVKTQQKNWIGQSHGYQIGYSVYHQGMLWGSFPSLEAFAFDQCHPDRISYLVIGPEHPLLENLPFPRRAAVQAHLDQLHQSESVSHTDGIFTGLFAMNPFISEAHIPIFVKGMLKLDPSLCTIGCPISNPEDASFATHHHIPIPHSLGLTLQSLLDQNLIRPHTHYRLKDWLVSRQRRWGTPIPIIHCKSCGAVPVPESDLPIIIPFEQEEAPTCECPKCHGPATREMDTMDTFVDSSWYWLRYLDPQNHTEMASPLTHEHLPVDIYVGGIEHAIMHLLYARFIAKFMVDDGLIVNPKANEPFKRLLTQGLVLGRTFQSQDGKYLALSSVSHSQGKWLDRDGNPVRETTEKMSKSKLNGVDPTDVIEKWGTDVARLFVLSRGHPSDNIVWDDSAIVGMERWLHKIDLLVDHSLTHDFHSQDFHESKQDISLGYETNKCIQEVTLALTESFAFHNAISFLIKFTKILSESSHDPYFNQGLQTLVQLMGPFAPTKHAQWYEKLSLKNVWPSLDTNALQSVVKNIVVQINGHKVCLVQLNKQESDLSSAVLKNETVRNLLGDKPIKRIIQVKDKLVNFVI